MATFHFDMFIIHQIYINQTKYFKKIKLIKSKMSYRRGLQTFKLSQPHNIMNIEIGAFSSFWDNRDYIINDRQNVKNKILSRFFLYKIWGP